MQSKSLKPLLKKVFTNPFVLAFLIGIGSLHIVKEMSLARRAAPPPLVNVGAWSLTSHEGKDFGTTDLKGKVVIANFFFTRCPTICPKLIQDMNEVRKRFEKEGEQVQFVSFSVDPEFDTPEVLRAYRVKSNITANNWTLVTSTTDKMVDVVMNKMKLHVGEKEKIEGTDPADELFNISHVAEFVLFDQNGDLRAKVSTDTLGLASIVRSAKFLLEQGA